jgi:hypothetical protein
MSSCNRRNHFTCVRLKVVGMEADAFWFVSCKIKGKKLMHTLLTAVPSTFSAITRAVDLVFVQKMQKILFVIAIFTNRKIQVVSFRISEKILKFPDFSCLLHFQHSGVFLAPTLQKSLSRLSPPLKT